jgi:hypothetical protein
MGKVLHEISAEEVSFIASQKVFFVATAPLSVGHHVSVSPKVNGCVVLDPHTIAYADLTGSGAETAARVLQNGRMTLMFCNIEAGPPKILRLFGRAEVILAENAPTALLKKFPAEITTSFGFRAIYKLRVHRISSSCGYSMPVMEFKKYRSTLNEVNENAGKIGVFDYNTLKNSFSIDGLPSLALLRKNAPTVEPVAEEGFIHGTVRERGSNTSRAFKLQAYNAPTQVNLRVRDLVLAGFSILVAGLVAGMFVVENAKLWR